MKIKFIFISLFISCFGFAQSHKASIDNVQQDGFHKIQISPEVRSATQDNLSYFRIYDNSKNEVPYVTIDDTNYQPASFVNLEIISKKSILDSLTSIILYNYDSKINNQLLFKISNTEINKKFNISGSVDGVEWFGLVSNQVFSNLNNTIKKSVTKSVILPINSYKYLKVDLNDKESLPINILNIGCYKIEQKDYETLILNDFKFKISEDKKNKKTIISFSSDNFQKVDNISFRIKTNLYSRNARILINKTRKIKKQTENYQEEIASFLLNSNTSNSFQFNSFFEKEFTIEIDNFDNQPLEFSKIEVLQNSLYVISYLKVNEKYKVLIDSSFSKPKYDLANFIEGSQHRFPKATISNLTKIASEKENTSEKPFWQSKAFMWICILFGIAIIGYFAIGLLKDMKKE